jgi:ferredoxin
MIKKRFILNFPPESGDKPLTYHLVKDFDIRINILKAEVFPGKRGSLLLEMEGTRANIEAGLKYLAGHLVQVEPLEKRIRFQDAKCIDCGNCVAVCFPGALTMVAPDWKLKFDKSQCVVCGLCVPACPLRLFDINF